MRAKSLKRWWPGTELNRRRQPFQSLANKYFQRLGTHGRHRKSLKITPGQGFCGLLCGLRKRVTRLTPSHRCKPLISEVPGKAWLCD